MTDIILEEADIENNMPSLTQIIDNQLYVIVSVHDMPDEIYDDCQEDKVRIISLAMKIIQSSQIRLHNLIKSGVI